MPTKTNTKHCIIEVLKSANQRLKTDEIIHRMEDIGWDKSDLSRAAKGQLIYNALRNNASLFRRTSTGHYTLVKTLTKCIKTPVHGLIIEVLKQKGQSMGPAAIWRELQERQEHCGYSAVRESLRRKFKKVNGKYYYVGVENKFYIRNYINEVLRTTNVITVNEAYEKLQKLGVRCSPQSVRMSLTKNFVCKKTNNRCVYSFNRSIRCLS